MPVGGSRHDALTAVALAEVVIFGLVFGMQDAAFPSICDRISWWLGVSCAGSVCVPAVGATQTIQVCNVLHARQHPHSVRVCYATRPTRSFPTADFTR